MDSPPKRRKTSTASAPTTPVRRPASSAAARTTPNRASFLSPTKASLSRFNPSLLPRPSSADPKVSRPRSRDGPRMSSPSRRTPIFDASGTLPDLSALVEEERSRLPQTPTATGDGRLTLSSGKGGLSASPRRPPRRSASPAKADAKAVTPIRKRSFGQLNFGSRQTTGAAERQDGSHEWVGDVGENMDDANFQADDEPDLPPTPAERGLIDPVMNNPPAGLFNTPSKRPKKRKWTVPPPAPTPPTKDATQRIVLDRPRHRARIPPAPYPGQENHSLPAISAKEKMRDKLREELLRLRQDVARQEAELARIQGEDGRAGIEYSDRRARKLMTLLQPPVDRERGGGKVTQDLAQSIAAFLPFAPRPKPPTILGPVPDSTPPSHRPVDVDDPLPYLQFFTPLTFTSTVTVPPASTSRLADLHQHHLITTISPLHLLTSTLAMVVNTRTNTVTDLTLRSLSGWAESELGTWIRSRASDDRKAIGRDISGICWAISRYWEAAEQRARFWIECEEEFGDLLPQSLGLATSKTKTSRQGHSKSKSWAREDDDDDDNDAVTRRELLAHLPTRSMTFSSWASHQNHNHKQRTPNSKVKPYSFMGPTIRLTWNIGLDWAGDVESRIFVTAAIPSSWKSKASAQAKGKAKGKGKGNGAAPGEIKGASGHEKDVAASIQAIFEDVRAKKGALVALRVVLGLLFPAS